MWFLLPRFTAVHTNSGEEGASGMAKGLGQEFVGFETKTNVAVLGLAAYPVQGLSRSVRALAKFKAKKIIKEAKWEEVKWLVKTRGF